jgi:hypothetical protein
METLIELKKTIFADGVIDEHNVNQLHSALLAGEGMNRHKADFLFEIKDSVSKRKMHKG